MQDDRTGLTGIPVDRRTRHLVELALAAGFLFGAVAGVVLWAVIS